MLKVILGNKDEALSKYIKNNDYIIFAEKDNNIYKNLYTYNWESKNTATALDLLTNRLTIIYDGEKIFKYDTRLARFFATMAYNKTENKIVCLDKLKNKNNYEIFAYFMFLDKKIIDVNHYWCFKANHWEESIFDGKPIRMLDTEYLAKKIYKHIEFNKEPENDLEEAVLRLLQGDKNVK